MGVLPKIIDNKETHMKFSDFFKNKTLEKQQMKSVV